MKTKIHNQMCKADEYNEHKEGNEYILNNAVLECRQNGEISIYDKEFNHISLWFTSVGSGLIDWFDYCGLYRVGLRLRRNNGDSKFIKWKEVKGK